MPLIGTLGGTLLSGPKTLKVKYQDFPHDGSIGLKWPAPANPPVTDNHHAGETGCGRKVEFLGWHRGYFFVLISCSRAFSIQDYTILATTEKTKQNKTKKKTKRFTWELCFWDGQIFPHQFLVVPECPTPLLGRDLFLSSKSCSYCSPDRRCFKSHSWMQTNYFYQSASEATPEWERPFMDVWSKDPQISSSADGKSRPHYIPLWGSQLCHPPAYPLFHSCL